MTYPGAHLRASCGNLDKAIEAVAVLAERERGMRILSNDGTTEHLTLVDGRATGVHSRIVAENGVAIRGTLNDDATFKPDASADVAITVIGIPDLGWDLVNSVDAKAFARGDIAAGVMVRSLAAVTWIHASTRTRWQASTQAADLVAKVLRDGRAAPTFVTLPGRIAVDSAVADLVALIGWYPLQASSYRRGLGKDETDVFGDRPTLQ
jgi:hypothetical protein